MISWSNSQAEEVIDHNQSKKHCLEAVAMTTNSLERPEVGFSQDTDKKQAMRVAHNLERADVRSGQNMKEN